MKKSKRFAAIAIAAVMTALCAGSVFAAGITYVPVNDVTDTSAAKLEKITLPETLKLQYRDTPIPNLTYTYTLDQTAVIGQQGTPAVNYGTLNAVSGQPTIKVGTGTAGASATINYGNKTETDVTRSDTEYGSTIVDNVIVDFSAVTFSEPGIYRYKITKAATGTDAPSAGAESESGKATNYKQILWIDVYVQDDGTVYLKPAPKVYEEPKTGDPNPDNKVDRYEDQFPKSRNDLTIAKKVTGNQGSRDQYFEFEVTLNNTIAGTTYTVDISNADATTTTNAYDSTAHTNDTSIVVPVGATTVTKSFWLKADQQIIIRDITSGIGYKIEEKGNTGYNVTTAVTGDTTNSTTDDIKTGTESVVEDASMEDATKVEYTNDKKGTTPTGIFLAMRPGLTTLVLAGAGLAVVGVSRRRRENDIED